MPSEAQLIEDRVLKAVDAYESGIYPTIKAAADAFNAPVQRVSRRLRGIPSEISRGVSRTWHTLYNGTVT